MGIYLNNQRAVFFVLLLAITSILYSSTLHAPFNFDDEIVIKRETSQMHDKFLKLYPPRYRHLFY